jgi:uncharacterized protein YgiM (DUF1202 family)
MLRFGHALLYALGACFLAFAPAAAFETEAMKVPYVVLRTAVLRAGPATSYANVGVISAGNEITVTGKARGANWYRIARADGSLAFIPGARVGALAKPPRTAPAASVRTVAYSVNRRQELLAPRDISVHVRPDSDSAVVGIVFADAVVTVTRGVADTDWYRIRRAGGGTGYVLAPDLLRGTATYLP